MEKNTYEYEVVLTLQTEAGTVVKRTRVSAQNKDDAKSEAMGVWYKTYMPGVGRYMKVTKVTV